MIDRTYLEEALYRAAICAFTYYPDKPNDEPGYTIDEDVTWCAAPLSRLPQETAADLTEMIRTVIADPSTDRRPFIAALAQLADDDQ